MLFASFPQTEMVQSAYHVLWSETEKKFKTQELTLGFLPFPVVCVDGQ